MIPERFFFLIFATTIKNHKTAKPLSRSRLFSILALLIVAIYFVSCTKELPPEEAEKHLRAFDTELISFGRSIQRTRSYEILHELMRKEVLPLPFFAHQVASPASYYQYDFEGLRGVYTLDTLTHQYVYSHPGDSLVLLIPHAQEADFSIELFIASYSEEVGVHNSLFITQMDAGLRVAEKMPVMICYEAEMAHEVPVKGRLEVYMEDHRLEVIMKNRLRKKHADVQIEITAFRGSQAKLQGMLRARVQMDESGGLNIRNLAIQFAAFPVKVDARVRISEFDHAEAFDFVQALNQNSQIQVFTSSQKGKLGTIKLKPREGQDRLDYAFVFNDGSFKYLEELLFTAERIMNIKK